jgi:hypothetical protein
MRKLSVVFVALALVVGFSVNAMAAQALFYSEKERLATAPTKELEVYGSVRFGTYWFTGDKEQNNAAVSSTRYQLSGQNFDDSDLLWTIDEGSTRFGVRFKSGKVGANVEIRPRDNQTGGERNSSNGLMRHWYGSYDMGFGTVLFGQTWTPTFNPICNECLLGGGGFLDGFGDFGGSARRPGIQMHMPIKSVNGLLKLAALEPSWRATGTAAGANAPAWSGLPQITTTTPYLGAGQLNPNPQLRGLGAATASYTQVDVTIPMLEASLSAAFGPTTWTLVGGYGSFDVKSTATDQSESIDTYVLGLDGTYGMGPFYLRGKFYYGQNLAALGTQAPSSNSNFGFLPAVYQNAAGAVGVEDVENWGWFGVIGFKFNDMISLEAGYGERHAKMDDPLVSGFTNEDTHRGWTVFMPISITPAFVITPEILYADYDELSTVGPDGLTRGTVDRGKAMAFGIYWRIDF